MKKLALIFIFIFVYQGVIFANSPAPMPESDSFKSARFSLVKMELVPNGIKDPVVIEAMKKVQRHEFVPKKYHDRAYVNTALPIGPLQTISQPYMVALMAQAIRPSGNDRVLEIGTGTGYSAAVYAEITKEVYTIEIDPVMAKSAGKRLKKLGYTNVHVKDGDGFFGWPKEAPFDAIVLTVAAEFVPPKLANQLKEGGKLVMPLGKLYSPQTLAVITKTGGQLISRPLLGVQFVPMVGEIENR